MSDRKLEIYRAYLDGHYTRPEAAFLLGVTVQSLSTGRSGKLGLGHAWKDSHRCPICGVPTNLRRPACDQHDVLYRRTSGRLSAISARRGGPSRHTGGYDRERPQLRRTLD